MAKVFLFGIDGAEPDLIFNQWREDLPNINRLMSSGSFARMKSTIPPTTIIAWNAMISGKDASELGVFSYTYKDSEGKTQLVSSKNIQSKLLWDILGEHNKRTIALYVPLSYPVKPIHGLMVSDFLTPSIDAECTFPLSLKEKIKKLGSTDIFFDVAVGLAGHKGLHLDHLAQKTKEMTEMQIRLVKDLAENESWDFFMTVMIGSDRLQHMAWRHFDPTHRRFIPDSPHKNTLKEYYIYLDGKLGEILSLLDKETTIIVASDHGMVKQEGKININYWLMEKRYLFLTEDFKQEIEANKKLGKKTRLKYEGIDMDKTIAYGGGAYNARILINRKKVGDKYDTIIHDLTKGLLEIKDDQGKKLKNEVFRSEEIYNHSSNPECPDLTVFFDELRWASNPDFGEESLYSWESAMGADSAGHSKEGCFVISGPTILGRGNIGIIDIRQVAPTILNLLNLPIPVDITIKPLELKEVTSSARR